MKVEAGAARIDRGAGDLVRLADPPQRRVARDGLQRVGILPQRLGEVGLDQPGRDAIDAHALRPEFGGKVARQLEVGGLGDVVGADHGRAGQPADRRDDDDRALAALEHFRRDHRDQPVIGDDIVVEDLAELVVADPRHRAVIGVGRGVADEHVDPAELRPAFRRPGSAAPPSTRCWRRWRSRVPSPCSALIAAATSSQASCLRLEMTTLAPCSASASAIALPIPRDEPVTIATFPVRSNKPLTPDRLRMLGEFDPRDRAVVDFVGAVGEAQRADAGPACGERRSPG